MTESPLGLLAQWLAPVSWLALTMLCNVSSFNLRLEMMLTTSEHAYIMFLSYIKNTLLKEKLRS